MRVSEVWISEGLLYLGASSVMDRDNESGETLFEGFTLTMNLKLRNVSNAFTNIV